MAEYHRVLRSPSHSRISLRPALVSVALLAFAVVISACSSDSQPVDRALSASPSGDAASRAEMDNSGPAIAPPSGPLVGLESDAGCLWLQECGTASDGSTCGVCDDGNPCTEDRCVDGFTCTHRKPRIRCDCSPSCSGDLRLAPAGVLSHASGGLTGLSGLRAVAVSSNEHHVYVAADESASLTHLVRVDGQLRLGESFEVGAVTTVVLASDERSVYAASPKALVVFTRMEDGRLRPAPTRQGGARGLATTGRWLVAAQGNSLRLYDRTAADSLSLVDTVSEPALAGVRQLAFSPDGKHLYAAGFDQSVLSQWSVSPRGLAPGPRVSGHPGLLNVDGVAVSPDGQHVYTVGFCDHSLGIFRRKLDSGALSFVGRAAPSPAVDGCVREMYGGEEDGATEGPFATPSSVVVSPDGRSVVVSAMASYFNLRVYRRDGDTLRLIRQLDESPFWMDYARFPWANRNLEGAGPPMPEYPKKWRGYTQAVFGQSQLYVVNAIVDALSEIDATGAARFTQKGRGGIGNLAGAYNLDLSPDDRHVYVAPRASNGVSVGSFAVDVETGEFTERPFDNLRLPQFGEGAVLNVTVTRPDGRWVGVVEADYPALYLFERDGQTGDLTLRDKADLAGCKGRRSFPVDVITSADGRHLYVADFQWDGDGCIAHFPITDEGKLGDSKVYAAPFLRGIENIVITGDGGDLYAACHEAASVAHYQRDPKSGTLEAKAPTIRRDLHGAEFLALAPDDRHAYVASPVLDTVVVLGRDDGDGSLAHVQTVQVGPGIPISGAAGVVVSPDGQAVFVAARDDDSITAFHRRGDGRLDLADSVVDSEHLDWVNGLVLSSDGSWLYASSVQSNSVTSWRVLRGQDDGCGGSCPR